MMAARRQHYDGCQRSWIWHYNGSGAGLAAFQNFRLTSSSRSLRVPIAHIQPLPEFSTVVSSIPFRLAPPPELLNIAFQFNFKPPPTLPLFRTIMSVFHYEPFYDFDRLLEDAFSPRPWAGGNQQVQSRGATDNTAVGAVRALRPRMDLHEDKEKNVVTATFELPGMKKEDIHLEIRNDRLSVSAESEISKDYDENGYAVRERRYGKFSRLIQLPQGVKDEEIKATMENGVLTVEFPKSTPELAPKKIAIS